MISRLLIITTGGTIDKVYFDDKSDYQVGESQVSQILRAMNVAFEIEVNEVLRKDSLHMGPQDRLLVREAVLQRSEVTAVYVVRDGAVQLRQVRLGTAADERGTLTRLRGGIGLLLENSSHSPPSDGRTQTEPSSTLADTLFTTTCGGRWPSGRQAGCRSNCSLSTGHLQARPPRRRCRASCSR